MITDYYTAKQIAWLHRYIFTNPYIKVKPYKLQMDMLLNPELDFLYYGSSGFGKSYYLLMEALKYMGDNITDMPYESMIIRRTYKNLFGLGMIGDIFLKWNREYINKKIIKWDNDLKIATFPNGNRLAFKYLDSDRDLDNVLGPRVQFIGVDEAINIKEDHLEILPTRIGDGPKNYDYKYRLCTNGLGDSLQYLLDNFVEREDKKVMSRKCLVYENPFQDENYINRLKSRSPFLRSVYLDGEMGGWPDDSILITNDRLSEKIYNIKYDEETPVGVIDGAGLGQDDVGVGIAIPNEEGGIDVLDTMATPDGNYEAEVFAWLEKNNCETAYYEFNGGADAPNSFKWLKKYIEENEFNIILKKVFNRGKSKWSRAKPFITSLHDNNSKYPDKKESFINKKGEYKQLMKECLYIHPDKEKMKKKPSPNILDSCAYLFDILTSPNPGFIMI